MVAASGVGGTFLARGFSQCWWDQTPRPPDKNGYIHTTHTHKQKSLYLSWSWSLVWLNNDAKTLLPTTFIPPDDLLDMSLVENVPNESNSNGISLLHILRDLISIIRSKSRDCLTLSKAYRVIICKIRPFLWYFECSKLCTYL